MRTSGGIVCSGVIDGKDGKTSVTYRISLAGSTFTRDPNTNNIYVNVKGKVYKTVGSDTSDYSDLTRGCLSMYFLKTDDTTDPVPDVNNIDNGYTVSGNTFVSKYLNNTNYLNQCAFVVKLTIDGREQAMESIQIGTNGKDGSSVTGPAGRTGRFYYYAKVYDKDTTYLMEETQAPYVRYINPQSGIDGFYMFDNKGVEPNTLPYAVKNIPPDSADPSNPWTLMSSEQQYYIARAFFGENAYLGSFIISGDWMISQYGTLVDSSGNSTVINASNVNTKFPSSGSDRKVPYAWFDASDPTASVKPLSGYKFVPSFAVDGLTGRTYQQDAYVNGIMKTKLMFAENTHIFGTKNIDPEQDPSYAYYVIPTGTQNKAILPKASDWDGLELRFYLMPPPSPYSNADSLIIATSGEDHIYFAHRLERENIPTRNFATEYNAPYGFTTVRSLMGAWYVVNDKSYGYSGDLTITANSSVTLQFYKGLFLGTK